MNKLSALALSLFTGLLIFYIFGGIPLVIVFLLLWTDKVIFGILRFPNPFGIELVTISTIILGIAYGPVFGFFFSLIFIPIIEGIKHFFIKVHVEWPPFIPSIAHLSDAIVAAIVGVLRSQPLTHILFVILPVKYLLDGVESMMHRKPVNFIYILANAAFNIIIIVRFQDLILKAAGL